jgi:predicted RNA polymerase sigma factor
VILLLQEKYRLAGLRRPRRRVRDARLADYQPYWAARADLMARLGWRAMAEAASTRAIELEPDPAVRRFLEQRRGRVRSNGGQ